MGKFRIRVKVQGFELEVDGDREDIPAITNAVQHQLSGMMQPADFGGNMAESQQRPPLTIDSSELKSRRPARKRGSRSASDSGTTSVIDFRHDPAKYGSPKQTWSVAQKCMWLLFVLNAIKDQAELSASQLTATWNSQFKAAGKLHPPNVPRDLGTAKVASPAPIGEDKGLWFLTEEGTTQAKALVKEGLGHG